MLVLTRGDAAIAFDAALSITNKLHSCHDRPPYAFAI
jgi:hypothetical protein